MIAVGTLATTTVYMIGGRSEDVTGTVVRVTMSRRDPSRVVAYDVDAGESGYGVLHVEAGKIRTA